MKNSFVTVSYTENAVDYQSGLAHGTVTLNPSREGDIRFSLIQASSSNTELQKYASRVRNREEDWYFNFFIINNSGGELASGDAAWIVKEPEMGFSQDQTDRAWGIKTANLTLTFNANYPIINAVSPTA